jgi:DNA-binding PadR family transcriptional regulator
MSSIRLFILDSLQRHGEQHGHQLRVQADYEHVQLWTDISVSSLYQVIKRLAAEGLIAEVRTERVGNFPERQVYGITPAGRAALKKMHHEALTDVWMKPDPFDLALARLDSDELDDLPAVLERRIENLRAMLSTKQALNAQAAPELTVGEGHALSHTEFRLRADIAWLEGVIESLPEIIAEARPAD